MSDELMCFAIVGSFGPRRATPSIRHKPNLLAEAGGCICWNAPDVSACSERCLPDLAEGGMRKVPGCALPTRFSADPVLLWPSFWPGKENFFAGSLVFFSRIQLKF